MPVQQPPSVIPPRPNVAKVERETVTRGRTQGKDPRTQSASASGLDSDDDRSTDYESSRHRSKGKRGRIDDNSEEDFDPEDDRQLQGKARPLR